MLEYLRIRGLALIDDMELEFGSGMNALTGETGAGKSFILKAINFVLGDKLATDMVRPGRDKAQVEALFTRRNAEGDEAVRAYCREHGLPLLAELPFDRAAAEQYASGKLLADISPEWRARFEALRDALRAQFQDLASQEVPHA